MSKLTNYCKNDKLEEIILNTHNDILLDCCNKSLFFISDSTIKNLYTLDRVSTSVTTEIEVLSLKIISHIFRNICSKGFLFNYSYLLEFSDYKYFLDDKDIGYNYGLRYASQYGHINIIKYLISNKYINAEFIRNNNSSYVIKKSIKYGKLDILKYVMENTDLTIKDVENDMDYIEIDILKCYYKVNINTVKHIIKYLISLGLSLSFTYKIIKLSKEHMNDIFSNYLENKIIPKIKYKNEHKKEWDYICGEIEYKPYLGIKYFEHLEEFIK